MSYQFPKRVLRTGDVLNPVELSEDFSPAADRVSGKLNAHNFNQSIGAPGVTTIDPQAFYDARNYTYYPVPFHWTGSTPGAFGYPDDNVVDAGMFQLQNNFEWQSLDTTIATISQNVTTGGSVLWINAYFQYLWFGFNPDYFSTFSYGFEQRVHANGAQYYACGLQAALRVNGNIIEETITGIDDLAYRASLPIKPDEPAAYKYDGYFPGVRDLTGSEICSMGPACFPIRLGACVPVQPGEQLVEIVCRRIPFTQSNSVYTQIEGYGQYDLIFAFSRQLHVAELKAYPVDSTSAVEVSAPVFEPEDTLSQASLYTQRLAPVVSALNSVEPGSLQRGALTHAQIPATLLGSQTTEQYYGESPGAVFNNWFPGHNDDTVTLTGLSGSPGVGWKLITDLSNNNPVKITGFTVAEKCQFFILANLRVRNIRALLSNEDSYGNPVTFGNFASFALFKLMWQYSGSGPTEWNGIESSTGMVNNFVWWPYNGVYDIPELGDDSWFGLDLTVFPEAPTDGTALGGAGSGPNLDAGVENVEVALMGVVSFTGAAPTGPINFGVFGGVANDGTRYQIASGNIIALAYRV